MFVFTLLSVTCQTTLATLDNFALTHNVVPANTSVSSCVGTRTVRALYTARSGGSRDRRERRAPVPHTSSTTGSARFIDSHVSFGLTCTCVSCMNSSSGTLARQFGTKHTSLSWTTSVLR